ncbi:glycosyltransferase [Dyella humicola]|uniref:glycosyltransferase n=1 Tax=Dyella humicola TaxID=2992126 RepID=UPI00224DC97E|nr:glycosyltransferase [Dyella humicola]
MQDWQTCLGRIESELDIHWPLSSQQVANEVNEYLRHDLRHQHLAASKDVLPGGWHDYLDGLYRRVVAIDRAGKWPEVDGELAAITARLAIVEPAIADLVPLSILDKMSSDLHQVEKERDAYKAEAQRIFDEKSGVMDLHLQDIEVYKAEAQRIFDEKRAVMELHLQDIEEAKAVRAAHEAELAHAKAERQRLLEELSELSEEVQSLRGDLVITKGESAKAFARQCSLDVVRAELEQIKASRSWRLTRPLRFLMRTVRHGGLASADQQRIIDLVRRSADATQAAISPGASADTLPAKAVSLAPAMAGKRDYFIWAVIDWHFRTQRPQHLARELSAAGHRVFYISNNFVNHPLPGFAVEPLDQQGRLFQVQLRLQGSPAIYDGIPTPDAREQLRAGLGILLNWTRSTACVSLVQHPYWLETARILPNSSLAYDCMDHHGGFADNSPEVLARERELMGTSDLLVVTSDWLYDEAGKHNPRRLMVRNACQYEHFARHSDRPFRDPKGRKVIGYYGAIAEWFDLDLVEKVARRFSDCLVLLVGADTVGAKQRLKHLANVEFTGEVPYAALPAYLDGIDVCLLPFQVIPLTLATNPVKVYEYLSAGKEVVSIDLPEIRQFGDLVRTGTDHASFIRALESALATPPGAELVERRRQFAASQTWAHRATDLTKGVAALEQPRVSVIVVTYNNLDLTKICLRSLEQLSDYSNLDVIVVDNASSDETPVYLQEWVSAGPGRRIILNDDNRGFAAANNQGLEVADGEYLVLLNNDTHVTPGWISTLVAHLRRNTRLGMIGPVTNNIGNEARIDILYDDMATMLKVSAAYTSRHVGVLTSLRTAAFFCVMMRRDVYEKVGPLDEAFGIGFFEDDDYCRRVEQAGWSIACADDVFVHHNLSASFNKLKQEKRKALFEANRAIYEAKWGEWVPHSYRSTT